MLFVHLKNINTLFYEELCQRDCPGQPQAAPWSRTDTGQAPSWCLRSLCRHPSTREEEEKSFWLVQ